MPKSKKSARSDYYTYVLMDSRFPGPFTYGKFKFTHLPRYVGKGSRRRSDEHVANAFQKIPEGSWKNKSHRDCWIRKVIADGGEILVKRSKLKTEDKAFRQEMRLILAIGRKDLKTGKLVNKSNGGEGVSGISEKNRRRIAEQSKRLFTGVPKSAEQRAKMSAWQKGVPKPKEAVEKLRQTMLSLPIVMCHHCGKEGRGSNMNTHHFDNCKFYCEGNDPY